MRIKSTNGDVTIAHQKWGWDSLHVMCEYLTVPMTHEPNIYPSRDCVMGNCHKPISTRSTVNK